MGGQTDHREARVVIALQWIRQCGAPTLGDPLYLCRRQRSERSQPVRLRGLRRDRDKTEVQFRELLDEATA